MGMGDEWRKYRYQCDQASHLCGPKESNQLNRRNASESAACETYPKRDGSAVAGLPAQDPSMAESFQLRYD